MKTRHYGDSKWPKPFHLRYGIMVPYYEVCDSDGNCKRTWAFVTEVDWLNKTYKTEKGKPALAFESHKSAQSLCWNMLCAFTECYVMEFVDDMIPSNDITSEYYSVAKK